MRRNGCHHFKTLVSFDLNILLPMYLCHHMLGFRTFQKSQCQVNAITTVLSHQFPDTNRRMEYWQEYMVEKWCKKAHVTLWEQDLGQMDLFDRTFKTSLTEISTKTSFPLLWSVTGMGEGENWFAHYTTLFGISWGVLSDCVDQAVNVNVAHR